MRVLVAVSPISLPTIGIIFSIVVSLAGIGALFVVRGLLSALQAAKETIEILRTARQVEKESRAEERLRWEEKVSELALEVKALKEEVASLKGKVVADLLKEVLRVIQRDNVPAKRRRPTRPVARRR